ncbi:hypothetical protein MBLNU13_g11221t1 [Cladosporium sp. NU13]
MIFAFGCIALVLIALFVPFVRDSKESSLRVLLQRLRSHWIHLSPDTSHPARTSNRIGSAAIPKEAQDLVAAQELQLYKTLYFQLQNLEKYPQILTQARDLLISLFAEKLVVAQSTGNGILSLPKFDTATLAKFLQAEDDKITVRWESYLKRRESGLPRELFRDLDHAKWWLKQISPVKYVDGAWLGHIHRVTTPFALRPITKKAWQIMSEELGDGDFTKNHVYLWRDLMEDIGADLSAPDTEDFIHPRHGLNKIHVWKAGVAQLLISIFPHEFLPEILGFNMHFEMLTWDTMRAIKELKELKLNDYYFLLHISIDNADSGHTAMAMQAVIDYMVHVQNTDGEAAAQEAWKRVQTGFILSEQLITSPDAQESSSTNYTAPNEFEAKVLKIFKAKALVSHKLHCASKVKIKSRKLVDWLDPVAFESEAWQKEFIGALANSKPWVRKGNSAQSRLTTLLAWDGKMFGSFTQNEVEVVRNWIDSLNDSPSSDVYWKFTGREFMSSSEALQNRDIRCNYPVLSPTTLPLTQTPSPMSVADLQAPITWEGPLDLEALIPLWFAHASLLEGLVASPYRTITPSSSAVIQVLRAQYGFLAEGDGVAGTDEYNRSDCIDLVGLGRELLAKANMPSAICIKDVLEQASDASVVELLHLSMKPMEHREVLLGMAWAFVALHELISSPAYEGILSRESAVALKDIAVREKSGLSVCLIEISRDGASLEKFCNGFALAHEKIAACFNGKEGEPVR